MPAPASRPTSPIPQYRLHKARGLGVVTLNGKDHYLGRHDLPESREAYNRLIAQWLSSGRQILPKTTAVTVEELMVAFMRHAEGYYRKPDGTPTTRRTTSAKPCGRRSRCTAERRPASSVQRRCGPFSRR